MLKKSSLVVENGLLWIVAGSNILKIGIEAILVEHSSIWLWSLVVFLCFGAMFFSVIKKNADRIYALEGERAPFYRFMSLKGYLTVIFMMTLGITLRHVGNIPNSFFSYFYTGLGAALAIAGISSFFRIRRARG